jgi:hypothetical protein
MLSELGWVHTFGFMSSGSCFWVVLLGSCFDITQVII